MKPGAGLENYTHFVYSQLLKLNDYSGVIVSKNVTIRGKSGATNEFDVFYQFMHLNIECKVAIECKDWKRAVPAEEVRNFVSKIEDVEIMGHFLGVMVSKNGYQEGAKSFAKSKGITLLTEEQLPSISCLMKGIIEKAFLPDRKVNGQPFWTLMEVKNGETTGTYYAMSGSTVPLFYSKTIARKILCSLPDAEQFEVRGVSQYQLRGFIAQMKILGVSAAIYCLPYWNRNNHKMQFVSISAEQLEKEYLY
jgi:hypothetical protein